MTRSRQLLAAALATAVVAGCTTQESADPVEPTAPPSTLLETTTTTAPTTTVPETTTTTTLPPTTTAAPTTTTPPPSGTPTGGSVRYYAGGDPDGWLYVGRWTGDGWEGPLDADGEPRDSSLDTSDVLIHEIGIDPIDGTVGATIELCGGTRSGPIISPNARAPEVPGFGYRSIAFEPDWNSEPRQIAAVDADIASYTAAGVEAFDGIDVDASSGAVRQIVVSDLDGDRDSESLVAFTGEDFSALLLIDADSGRATRVVRDFPRPPEAPTGTTLAGATTTTVPPDPIERYRVLTVADLNGDGLMEFVVHSWTEDQEAEVLVYTYDGTEVDAVLRASC
jgi:hypothetical protein